MKLYNARLLELIEEVLLEYGRLGRTITYSELARTVNERAGACILPLRGRGLGSAIGRHLRELCGRYYRRFGVLPGSLVVLSGRGVPSRGYFAYLRELGVLRGDEVAFWRESLERFFTFCRRRSP